MGSTKQKPPLVSGRRSICCKPTFNYPSSIAGIAGVNHLFPETCSRPPSERDPLLRSMRETDAEKCQTCSPRRTTATGDGNTADNKEGQCAELWSSSKALLLRSRPYPLNGHPDRQASLRDFTGVAVVRVGWTVGARSTTPCSAASTSVRALNPP